MFDELTDLLSGQVVTVMLKSGTIEEYLKDGTKLTGEVLADVNFSEVDLKTLRVADKAVNEQIRAAIDAANAERARIEEKAEEAPAARGEKPRPRRRKGARSRRKRPEGDKPQGKPAAAPTKPPQGKPTGD